MFASITGSEQHNCLQAALEELLLVGNPLYNEYKDKGETQAYRIEVRPWQAVLLSGRA